MLQYDYIFQIKYTEAILSNSIPKSLWFEITKMFTAVLKNKFIVPFTIIFGTLSLRTVVQWRAGEIARELDYRFNLTLLALTGCQCPASKPAVLSSSDQRKALTKQYRRRYRPEGRRDDMPPPTAYRYAANQAICVSPRIQKSRRIYVRPRTGPHISGGRRWLSCRQPACLLPRQLRRGRDGRTDGSCYSKMHPYGAGA